MSKKEIFEFCDRKGIPRNEEQAQALISEVFQQTFKEEGIDMAFDPEDGILKLKV